MKPRQQLNLDALRSNRLPRLVAPPESAIPRDPVAWNNLEVTRRNLFGMATVAGLGLSPSVHLLEKLVASAETPFTCEASEIRIAFTVDGEPRWVIDTARFSGRPRLTCVRGDGLIRIELRDALFPGTRLPADLDCELRARLLSWQMTLALALGGFRARVNFGRWLKGEESARSEVRLKERASTFGKGTSFRLAGNATAQFSPNWEFAAGGAGLVAIRGLGSELLGDSFRVALLSPEAPSLLTRPGRKRTLIAIERGAQTWLLAPEFRTHGHGRLVCPDNAFTTLHLEASESGRGDTAYAVLAESGAGEPRIRFHPKGRWEAQTGEPLSLPLAGARYVRLVHPASNGRPHHALAARFGDEPVYLRMHGCTIRLGQTNGALPFELVQRGARANHLCCEPGIVDVRVPLPGAVVEPMQVAPGARLRLAQLQRPQAGQVAPPGPVSPGQVPQARPGPAPGVQAPIQPGPVLIPKADFRFALLIPGPIHLSVVRPEDLLVLKFEFRNLNLQVAPNQPPRLVRTPNQPAQLIVNFPPQHIAEQAFYEVAPGVTQPTKPPDDTRNEPTGLGSEKPAFPIRAQISGWSRLAFDLPNQIQAINFTLGGQGGLLDWSHLTLRVASVADPPPPPPLKSIRPLQGHPSVPQGSFQLPQSRQWPSLPGSPYPSLVHDSGITDNGGRPVPVRYGIHAASWLDPGPAPLAVQAPIQGARPTIKTPPNPEQLRDVTAIEAPYRLFISPSVMAGWIHSWSQVVKNGRTELWHTRLGGRNPDGSVNGTVLGKDDWYRACRAIWSPDYNPADPAKPGHFNSQFPDPRNPFRMSLDAKDRNELVHLMARGDYPGWPDRVGRTDYLMLSALGAWMRLRYEKPLPSCPPSQPNSPLCKLTVLEWAHHANMGRDQFVKVVYAGYLFPFGHAASLIKITERKFQPTPDGSGRLIAVLRQRMFIVVREPVKYYPMPGEQFQGRAFPYKSLRLTTLVTPNLHDPNTAPSPIPNTPSQSAFWPIVGGQDFKFHAIGTDWAGRSSEFAVPMVFVSRDRVPIKEQINKISEEYMRKQHEGRRTASLSGQRIAFAQPKKEGDTVLETEALIFGTSYYFPTPVTDGVTFAPYLDQARVRIPAVEALLGTDTPVTIRYDLLNFLVHNINSGFDPIKNKGEVFCLATSPLSLRFPSDKAGGVLNPDLNVTAISRAFGPVGGDPGRVARGEYLVPAIPRRSGWVPPALDGPGAPLLVTHQAGHPPSFFEQFFADAQILGGILLGKIINSASPPGLVTQVVPPLPGMPGHTTTTYHLETSDLISDPLGIFAPQGGAKLTVTSRLFQEVKLGEAPSSPQFSSVGDIEKFNLNLFEVLDIRFKKLHFEKRHGKKLNLDPDLASPPVKFKGALQFVNKLSEIIPSQGFSDPPSLNVTSEKVTAGYSLAVPPVAVGAFSLENVKLKAAITIPFSKNPVSVRFAFSERQDPFLVQVALFAGGGFFAIEVDTSKGMKRLELSLEFGAKLSLNLGVAAGVLYALGGVYINLKVEGRNQRPDLSGYLRMGGAMSVLGLITVSVEFRMALEYDGSTGAARGVATLVVRVEVLFFEADVELTIEKQFAGSPPSSAEIPSGFAGAPNEWGHLVSDGLPHRTQAPAQSPSMQTPKAQVKPLPQALLVPRRIAEVLSPDDWLQYSGAFASDKAA